MTEAQGLGGLGPVGSPSPLPGGSAVVLPELVNPGLGQFLRRHDDPKLDPDKCRSGAGSLSLRSGSLGR